MADDDERKPMANIPPFGLRMQPDLKARVEASARQNNRSLNAEIVACLEERFPAPTFNIDEFVTKYVVPISSAPNTDEMVRLATIANSYLDENRVRAQGLAVLIEDDEDGNPRVVLGFMNLPSGKQK